MKGEARSFDINYMQYENRIMFKHLANFMEFVEDEFLKVSDELREVKRGIPLRGMSEQVSDGLREVRRGIPLQGMS